MTTLVLGLVRFYVRSTFQYLVSYQRNIGLVLGCFMTWLEKEKYRFLKIKLLTL